MPATPARDVRKPSAATVSRLLADHADMGLHRAPSALAVGFTVKNVGKEPERHGGPVIVRWNQSDQAPEAARLVEHGRHTLMRGLLEEAGFAVTVHHEGYLVLLAPDQVEAHREAETAAAALLGDAGEFWREGAGMMFGDATRKVARVAAVAEVALALRTGRSPYAEGDAVTVEGDFTVNFVPIVEDQEPQERPESPLSEARRIFAQAGETVLDIEEAVTGTGVWVRESLVPDEVLVLRKDDGMRASGFTAAARRWETLMEFYRRLLEGAGWSMTGRGDMGWSFYRPSGEDALTRAEKTLIALWPRFKRGERAGWVISRHEGSRWNVGWRSDLDDEDRREAAEVAMLPYLADALRRVGLSTTMPDELPHLDDELPYAPAVYFAEPPKDRTGPRYQTGWLREGWTMDTHTGYFRRKAASEEHAVRLAALDNRDEETDRRLGRVSDGLPGLTDDLAEVPEFRMVAAELAAAGYMPSRRWENHDRLADGFAICQDEKGLQVNHLTTQPDGGHRITLPEEQEAHAAFYSELLGYVEALDGPGRLITLKPDHLVVYGAEEPRRSPLIPDGQMFDAAVTYRLDHGAPRTVVHRFASWSVDPHGFGEPLRHRVAELVAAGRDVYRFVVDDVRPFEQMGTRRHQAQTAAAELLVRALGPTAVWRAEVDPLWKQNPGIQRKPDEEGVLLLSVPDNAPEEHAARIAEAADEAGWSPAQLGPRTVWVKVPVGGEAMG
ncbi:hypothetical protein [Streptomyces sp. NPDC001536]|uniref:hypothetical protein n=1 Tax=Streptomyces sp. NPDC001536 TaxID=3364583 RepID=UPI0036B186E6